MSNSTPSLVDAPRLHHSCIHAIVEASRTAKQVFDDFLEESFGRSRPELTSFRLSDAGDPAYGQGTSCHPHITQPGLSQEPCLHHLLKVPGLRLAPLANAGEDMPTLSGGRLADTCVAVRLPWGLTFGRVLSASTPVSLSGCCPLASSTTPRACPVSPVGLGVLSASSLLLVVIFVCDRPCACASASACACTCV